MPQQLGRNYISTHNQLYPGIIEKQKNSMWTPPEAWNNNQKKDFYIKCFHHRAGIINKGHELTYNLIQLEYDATHSLRNDSNIIFKEIDKVVTVVVMEKPNYIEESERNDPVLHYTRP